MAKLAVLGAGAWGTALAMTYAGSNHDVALWSFEASHVMQMREARENARYLPGLPLAASIRIEDSLTRACESAELILIATPVAGLRETLQRLQKLAVTAPILWACKGFETGSGLLPHEVVADVLGTNHPCGALTGPSFAQEVAQGLPCAITLASKDAVLASHWARELHHPRLRLYANDDVVGAETGGAVKNVLAIAAGISDGLGYGFNARAAIMTRGLAEIARMAEALGGRRETLMGLAGMGDLILTCTGDLSRNRRVGLALASGQPLAEILRTLGHVAEGVLTTQVAVRRAEVLGVDMPITRAVHDVLAGRVSPRSAVEQLMARDPRPE
ncbi:NAD(P)H-dependent glycerol-3-phosphate dehydrogenase [Uliginosibacterium sp. H3]|uniref:Glycerol-3-phosphate dehydrogenase [NAD(P)+] n=1 Tax=Uliginosibacterium silvisoli TaxID=3114758 RepID=A0ABU6K7M1_9RHOO|nr:NAD(P)H-dependent glycerol-3-phosphate dehydrogenase [Uliginosibacterium sp. H3]